MTGSLTNIASPEGFTFADKTVKFSGAGYMVPNQLLARFHDDFLLENTTLDTASWNSVDCVGTGTAFACTVASGTTVGHGGWARGTSGATSGNCTGLFGELWWKASQAGADVLAIEARLSIPVITLMGFNFGLVDARTYAAIPVSYATTTFTTTPVDSVVFAFDTSGTDPDLVRGIGTKNNVDTGSSAGVAPVAATATTLRIEITSAGTASWYQDGTLIGSAANAVTTSVALCPMLAVFTREAVAKSIDVDYVTVSCLR